MLYIPEPRRAAFWHVAGRFLRIDPVARKKRFAEIALRHMSEHMQRDLGVLDGNYPYERRL